MMEIINIILDTLLVWFVFIITQQLGEILSKTNPPTGDSK